MAELPLELWFYIAQFVPSRDLPKLVGVNRVFFELIMNELYSQLSFISSDPRVFSEKLRALQDPALAERVRVLTLWPGAIREALRAKGPEKAQEEPPIRRSPSPKSQFKHNRYLLKGRNYVGELLGHRRTPSLPVVPTKGAPLISSQERLELFIESFRNLTHVEELELNWYIDTGTGDNAWSFGYFPEIWQSIGQNLRKLTIDIQVFKINDAVKQCGNLTKVEELHLTLRTSNAFGHPDDTFIPYFINKFSPSLQYLSIKTIGHQELSQNFQLLGLFPQLNRFSINLPLDIQHMKDPWGLRVFLRNHPKLRDLSIRYTRCCNSRICDGFEAYDGKHDIYSDVTLPALHSLELGLQLPISDKANALYKSIARLGDNLTSLTLLDRSLKLDEVKTVLKFFLGYHLKKLSLFARLLSPQLIDYIAQVCPTLNSLMLDVETVVKSDNLASPTYTNDVLGFEEALRNYAVDLENDRWRYRAWVLSDITIMKWESVGHMCNWQCMDAIAYVIPSVRSFAGRGHMEHDDHGVPKPGIQRRLLDLGDREKPLDT